MIRILDSSLQSGLVNNAIDRYYLGLHARGECSDRLRFYRSKPCVSIGCHQIIDREVRIDYCRDKHIDVLRRVSGGGAVYQDPQQLAWSLIVRRPGSSTIEQMLEFSINRVLCNPLVDESDAAHRLDWNAECDFALEALWKTKGGTLRARAGIDSDADRLEWAEFGGDVHIAPGDWIERLQTALQGTDVAEMQRRATDFFHAHPADMLGFDIKDLLRLLQMLQEKLSLHRSGHLSSRQLNALMIYSPDETGTQTILNEASVMLIPYCAKPVWCEWRLRDDCPECGLCEVGDAYRIARERNMQVTTITHYEHLVATLTDMKARNVPAYIGMCCSSFFIKRHRAFHDAGMPALLMDISGANCYELKQEELAYAGRFQAQAHLDGDLLQQVIKFMPRAIEKTGL